MVPHIYSKCLDHFLPADGNTQANLVYSSAESEGGGFEIMSTIYFNIKSICRRLDTF